MKIINQKLQILESIEGLSVIQRAQVLDFIKGLQYPSREDQRHQKLKTMAIREIQRALGRA